MMMTRSLFRATFLMRIFCSLAAPLLLAQTNFGRISGTVSDPSGAVIPGAKVLITNVDTQGTADAV